jgi:hypothetical protein
MGIRLILVTLWRFEGKLELNNVPEIEGGGEIVGRFTKLNAQNSTLASQIPQIPRLEYFKFKKLFK